MKTIYSGLEGSGKSLRLAMQVGEIAHRNGKWFKKSGVSRPLASNLRFSSQFEQYYSEELGLPPIIYWQNIEELIKLKDCDVIIDEVGNYFDSRLWADLSLDARRWLSQGSKAGIEIYGSAQDFAQVDKSFRRLVNHLYLIRKLIGSPRPSNTKPPVKRIWGFCLMMELDPLGYDEDKKKFKGEWGLPHFFWIDRKYCEMFDTGQIIQRSKTPPLKHVDYECEDSRCGWHKVAHV